jgi:hypothetical protein
MTRFASVCLVTGALLLGTPKQASCVHPIVARLALYASEETANFLAEALVSEVMQELREGRYTARAVAVAPSRGNAGPCLALPQSFEVIMTATSDGKPISKDPRSATLPYDPNARVFMTSVVKVEVAAFYPVKDIRSVAGRLVLPKDPQIIAGYRGKEGERSTWKYHGGARWSIDKQKAVANDLTLKALDVAREYYARSQTVMEEELSKKFEKEIDRLVQEATRGLERRKP